MNLLRVKSNFGEDEKNQGIGRPTANGISLLSKENLLFSTPEVSVLV